MGEKESLSALSKLHMDSPQQDGSMEQGLQALRHFTAGVGPYDSSDENPADLEKGFLDVGLIASSQPQVFVEAS